MCEISYTRVNLHCRNFFKCTAICLIFIYTHLGHLCINLIALYFCTHDLLENKHLCLTSEPGGTLSPFVQSFLQWDVLPMRAGRKPQARAKHIKPQIHLFDTQAPEAISNQPKYSPPFFLAILFFFFRIQIGVQERSVLKPQETVPSRNNSSA